MTLCEKLGIGLVSRSFSDTLDYVVMALLDTQNQIIKASGIMEVVKLEEEAKAKIRELKVRKVSNE